MDKERPSVDNEGWQKLLEFRVYYYFALFTNRERALRYAQQNTWTLGRMYEDYKGTTVEPLFNKVASVGPAKFVR